MASILVFNLFSLHLQTGITARFNKIFESINEPVYENFINSYFCFYHYVYFM
jgi:hypothetical protein